MVRWCSGRRRATWTAPGSSSLKPRNCPIAIKDCLENRTTRSGRLTTGEEAAEKSVTLAADLVLIWRAPFGRDERDGCRASDQGFHRRTRGPSELPLRHSHRALRVRSQAHRRKVAGSDGEDGAQPVPGAEESRGPERRVEVRISDDRMTAVPASLPRPRARGGSSLMKCAIF